MNIHDVAEMTSRWIQDNETAAIMAAIAMAESGGNPDAEGDHIGNYGQPWFDRYSPYAVNGYNAHGLFQVFLYWHSDKLERLTGSTDPDEWALWLKNPENNMRIALEILESSGYSAWSVFNVGVHKRYLDDARREVAWWRQNRPVGDAPTDRQAVLEEIDNHLLRIKELIATL